MSEAETADGSVPVVDLNAGVGIPQLGCGFDRPDDREAQEMVEHALACGYRMVDTATIYRNETGIGAAIAASGLDRSEVFVTTKLWNGEHGRENAYEGFATSLKRLKLDYVDLLLIHWPFAVRDLYVQTWQAMEDIRAEGRARAIGVSNFEPSHLDRLGRECATVPAINQIELHPVFQQQDLRRYHADHGIVTEAWRPLALGQVLENEVLTAIAQRHDRTTAQVVLRWHIQLGNVIVPKSGTPARIRSNFEIFDFELSDEDMAKIARLECGGRIGPHPDEFDAVTDDELEKWIEGVDPKRPAMPKAE
jgi:2,5-diketo-D-gluconate reductase A